jgi:hypothetical protein
MQMKAFRLFLAGAFGLAATALVYAQQDQELGGGEPAHASHAGHMHGPAFSVEHAAMHNLVVAGLAVKTGRSPDDIAKLFEKGHPPEVAKQLGLDEEAMHGVFANAHRTLIDRMLTARLITPDQAEQLRAAPLPMHGHEMHEHETHEAQ